MINAPAIKYYGDTVKATALKGVALQFYQYVCMQLGSSTSITREKRTSIGVQSVVIKASIFLNGYRDINGKVDIFVQPIIQEENDILFCTSFNTDDLGTQVYKNPFKPRTELGLIDVLDNPSFLILPDAEYRSRNNYWVNNKENEAVSWDYIDVMRVPPYYYLVRYGRISISGVENDNSWGEFLEPLCCALIDNENMVIIYINIAVFNYVIDTDNHVLLLTELSKFEFDWVGRGMHPRPDSRPVFYGISGDAKRVFFLIFIPGGGGTILARLSYFDFESDYLSIINESYIDSDIGSFVDVRGKYVSLSWFELVYGGDVIRNHYIANINENLSFNRQLLGTTVATESTSDPILIPGTGDGRGDGHRSTTTSNSSGIARIHFYSKKLNDVIYSEFTLSIIQVMTQYDDGSEEINSLSINHSETLKSTKHGVLHSISSSGYITEYIMIDYSYTKHVLILSFTYGDGNISCILNYKKKAHKIFDYLKSLLSVTKLPQVTTP
jgi:hypothetical protein